MKIRVTGIALLAVSLAQAVPVLAQQTQDLKVGISLLESDVCLHEPVQVLLSIANSSDRKIAINLGRQSEEYISIATKQPEGRWKSGKPLPRSGFAGLGILRLKPGEEKTRTFIADKWIGNLEQGTYQLRITLHVPATNREWDPPSDLVLAGEITKEEVFDLQVKMSCPTQLAALANSDLTSILETASVESRQKASEHLSYIDDDVAVPYMERAVVEGAVANRDIMDGLERIGDESASKALVRLSMNSDSNIAAYARQKASNLAKP